MNGPMDRPVTLATDFDARYDRRAAIMEARLLLCPAPLHIQLGSKCAYCGTKTAGDQCRNCGAPK